ncbi:unnamed protein product [Clavelina lepadiformis]|uniref:Mitochondrial tRNA-specific 2-thiouridylase 1 n=1 Tax=Clavelina lepadiformis TaxID=159417 RepID=A0ABP0GCB7_CLALP
MVLPRIICAISGGVDSAVAALLLKRKGYHVLGIFMRNWDVRDEIGHCTVDEDVKYAKRVCSVLNIPFREVNLVKEYWSNVFMPTIEEYENGNTPNPDVLCNRHIKFDSLHKKCHRLFGDDNFIVATGHYAQTTFGERVLKENMQLEFEQQLLMSVDKNKDQTFFLHEVALKALLHTYFPVGHLHKTEVKEIAASSEVDFTLERKESMGICFIGKRNFSDFIQDYVPPKKGSFVCYETGRIMGEHSGYYKYTIGQRTGIGGLSDAYAVLHRDVVSGNVYVVHGMDHPALYCQSFITNPARWISGVPDSIKNGESFKCKFRFLHREPLVECEVIPFQDDGRLLVILQEPQRAITVGQNAVFYSGDQCLGGGRIDDLGPSTLECQERGQLNFTTFRKNPDRWRRLVNNYGEKLCPFPKSGLVYNSQATNKC